MDTVSYSFEVIQTNQDKVQNFEEQVKQNTPGDKLVLFFTTEVKEKKAKYYKNNIKDRIYNI